ncbi:hypothetical protein ACF07Y_37070 [Streptomyces sp. NPDC016566]|uniref:hypothetical protein n=1 Tax=Streptomyces sp. NPDC016566 TaxID=3364967 RepID=UPI0036F84DA8
MKRNEMKRLALSVAAMLLGLTGSLAATATPAAAATAPNTCWTVTDTSSNYEYKCEFGIFPLANTASGDQVKQAVFNTAITHFSTYFPFSGCGSVLVVGNSCTLMPGSAPVKVDSIGSNYFILKSLPGHPEGPDRYIKFAFYILDNQLRLGVRAWGPSTYAAKATVSSGTAEALWGQYATNLYHMVYP